MSPSEQTAALTGLFPEITSPQIDKLLGLEEFYRHWNSQINVISRKDMDAFFTHHVLHSLGLARVHPLNKCRNVLDIGTGGGFPGIPLAILYPQVEFLLVDSIGKKIKVVDAAIDQFKLSNCTARKARAEEIKGRFDCVVSRAVARLEVLGNYCKSGNIKTSELVCLKGGDLREEIAEVKRVKVRETLLSKFFTDEFFETKKVVEVMFIS